MAAQWQRVGSRCITGVPERVACPGGRLGSRLVSVSTSATAKLCAVEGCERPVRKRGWCGTHYQRWRRSGGRRRADHTYSPPDVQDAAPVRELRRELAQLRDAGAPFDVAWTISVEIIGPDLAPWSDALTWAHADWRAAYCRELGVHTFGVPDPWRRSMALVNAIEDLVAAVF